MTAVFRRTLLEQLNSELGRAAMAVQEQERLDAWLTTARQELDRLDRLVAARHTIAAREEKTGLRGGGRGFLRTGWQDTRPGLPVESIGAHAPSGGARLIADAAHASPVEGAAIGGHTGTDRSSELLRARVKLREARAERDALALELSIMRGRSEAAGTRDARERYRVALERKETYLRGHDAHTATRLASLAERETRLRAFAKDLDRALGTGREADRALGVFEGAASRVALVARRARPKMARAMLAAAELRVGLFLRECVRVRDYIAIPLGEPGPDPDRGFGARSRVFGPEALAGAARSELDRQLGAVRRLRAAVLTMLGKTTAERHALLHDGAHTQVRAGVDTVGLAPRGTLLRPARPARA